MKKLILITLLLPVLMFNPQAGFAQSTSIPDTALTFVLSNEEPGYLIDDLIAAGYGNNNLYQVMQAMKPVSDGAIPEDFMSKLAACPDGSEIFMVTLSSIALPGNNPIGISTDGTLRVVPIYGYDYFRHEGYGTSNGNHAGVGDELFTYAISPNYYIDAGTGTVSGGKTTNYRAFVIAWSMAEATTFVLSNEAPGYLIDTLIAAGLGNSSLYEVLVALKPASGGVISQEFIDKLANCPAGSEVKTVALSNFAGLNNPVCANSDGTMMIEAIFGKDYFGKEGYTTYPEVGSELFTYAISPEYYIDAGASGAGTRYKTFAIAWSNSTDGIPDAETIRRAPYAYPNPFSDGFYVQNQSENTLLEIFDIQGKLLYQTEPKDNSMVRPGQLHDGIYFLKLINSQGTRYQKIVKY